MFHTSVLQPTIGNFTRSDRLAYLSPQTSITPVPFGFQAMTASARILYTFSMQIQEPTGTTTPITKELLSPPSATNNPAHTDTTINLASGPLNAFGEKTIQALTSHGHELFYPKSARSSTTSTLTLNLHDQSLLHSFLLSPTLLDFPHLHYPK